MLPRTLLPFLTHFLKPYRKPFAGMVFSTVLYAALAALSPYLLKVLVNALVSYEKATDHLFKTVGVPAILFVILYQLMDLSWVLFDYFKFKTLPRLRADILNALFAEVQQHAYRYFQHHHTGALSTKIADMARAAESVVAQTLDPLFGQLLTLGVAVISMYCVHPYCSAILGAWATVFLGIAFLFYKKTLLYSADYSESNSVCMGKLVDSVSNIINSKLFAQTAFEKAYLAQYVEDAKQKETALQRYMFKVKALQGASVGLLFGSMLAFLVYGWKQHWITIGDFAFILSLSITIMQGFWYLASHLLFYSEQLGICRQALSVFSAPVEIVDAPNATALVVHKGEISFENVDFNYEKNKNIFQNKSLTIEGGQKLGLVGFSGSGKTTFASLILRFFDVTSGRILIDGQDIQSVTQDSLHAQIAMIPQDPMLFHRSLLENIRYGRPEATLEEVIEASKLAHCHEFIEQMPEGYDTDVGERGLKLSGGQRQRIAIARAILKNAPILILDEATSALDSLTEKKIQESLQYLMKNRTTIVIAHRLSTLSGLDRILVFSKGEVVEEGDPVTLLEKNGLYAKLWHLQAGGFLPEQLEETLDIEA